MITAPRHAPTLAAAEKAARELRRGLAKQSHHLARDLERAVRDRRRGGGRRR